MLSVIIISEFWVNLTVNKVWKKMKGRFQSELSSNMEFRAVPGDRAVS